MSAHGAGSLSFSCQPQKRRRWLLRWLGAFAALAIVGAIMAVYLLQPAQLTALVLDRASIALKLELHASGPGSYALRPEPRLVLPGLTATIPGESKPFFRSTQVEFALPWATLRGRSADISSIVLKSPDLDVPGLQRWLATQPPRTTPFKLPTLTRGLQVDDGLLRGTNWRIANLDAAMPSLADNAPNRLDASGVLQHGANASKFTLALASTPAGIDQGLRIDNARLVLTADGELPSLTANGSLRAGDDFALDLAGAMQHVPATWSDSVDSSYAKPGGIPFAIVASDGAPATNPGDTAATASTAHVLKLQLKLGDANRQPALTFNAEASNGETLEADVHGQLSRWPDAWPGLPVAIAANADPIVFNAKYQGSIFLIDPVVFDATRAGTGLKGKFRIADLRAWIDRKYDPLLPPVEATLNTPQFDIDGVQLRGVQLELRDDPAPSPPVVKPASAAPKS